MDHVTTRLDVTLKEIRIDRQAYYGGTIIGNHCHKLLQDKNIDTLCKSISLVLKEVGKVIFMSILSTIVKNITSF